MTRNDLGSRQRLGTALAGLALFVAAVVFCACDFSTLREKVTRNLYEETFTLFRNQTKDDIVFVFEPKDSVRGWFSVQVSVLACCWRTARLVTTRLPKRR